MCNFFCKNFNFYLSSFINKQVSSDNQIYRAAERRKLEVEISTDEPEAVIVEVEDDGLEIMSTTPQQMQQIPIFKFDFVNKDSTAR